MKSKESLGNFWDTIIQTNTHIMWVPGGEDREKEAKSFSKETIAEKFSIVCREMDIQIQEAPQTKLGWAQRRPH